MNTSAKHLYPASSATFSKNGKFLASVSHGEILISEVDSGKHIQTIENPFSWLHYLSFSDDGTSLISDMGEVAVHTDPTDSSNSPCN